MDKHEIELFEKQRIAELLDRLKQHGQTIKDERSKLWHIEKGSPDSYVVWERLEILSADIIGYISGIGSENYRLKNPKKAVEHLHSLNIFDVECIMKWYPTAAEEYPRLSITLNF